MCNQSILKEAQGHWVEILSSNGIDQKFLQNKHGPCPICNGKDRFRFDDKEGRGTFFCNQCGSGDGIKLLMLHHNCDFKQALAITTSALGININPYYPIKLSSNHISKPIREHVDCVASENDLEKRRYKLNKAWETAIPISPGDPVQCYLSARGLNLDSFPDTLRYHPALPYYEDEKLIDTFPAMLGLVTDERNQLVTLHRTYLENGKKAEVPSPKKLMSPIADKATRGAAIQLYEPQDGILAVAEGIENALAFYLATKIPTWSAISAGGMEQIILPLTVKEVIIVVDNDLSGRGQKAAIILSDRMLAEDRKVRRVMPPKINSDFADLLLERY